MGYDIIIVGASIKDNFIFLDKKFSSGKSINIPLGNKIILGKSFFSAGGGGVNTAISFCRYGFKPLLFSKIGNDSDGDFILSFLKKHKVASSSVAIDRSHRTSVSFILSLPKKERTILTDYGASNFLSQEEINWQSFEKAKWLYLAPLEGRSAKLLPKLISVARRNKLKIGVNLSLEQIIKEKNDNLKNLKKVDVIFLNEEELAALSGREIAELKKNAILLGKKTNSIIVVTLGKKGSLVYAGGYFLKAPAHKITLAEKTGTGDAFASGFIAGLLKKNNIEYAIQLATDNAASCAEKAGASSFISAKKKIHWEKLKINITKAAE